MRKKVVQCNVISCVLCAPTSCAIAPLLLNTCNSSCIMRSTGKRNFMRMQKGEVLNRLNGQTTKKYPFSYALLHAVML